MNGSKVSQGNLRSFENRGKEKPGVGCRRRPGFLPKRDGISIVIKIKYEAVAATQR
jgi:hypothetical protein